MTPSLIAAALAVLAVGVLAQNGSDSKHLFAEWAGITAPMPGDPAAIGFYSAGCLQGGQVLPLDGGVYELRGLAVLSRRRRRGLGTRLVARSASWVRDQSGNRLVAGIPSSDLDVLGFSQRLGFRVLRVDRDAYGPERGYPDGLLANGIQVRDRVWLELEL